MVFPNYQALLQAKEELAYWQIKNKKNKKQKKFKTKYQRKISINNKLKNKNARNKKIINK